MTTLSETMQRSIDKERKRRESDRAAWLLATWRVQRERAEQRELRDEHLNDAERTQLVELYRQVFPDEAAKLPSDLNAAFVEVVFE